MFTDILTRAAHEMGISLSDESARKMSAFHNMLIEANRTMNLTRVSELDDEAIRRNYLDSIAPLAHDKFFEGAHTLIDIGSGAGFPGIPLAIALPHVRCTLVDSLGKRVAFMRDVIKALSLNAEAIHARAEDLGRIPQHREAFDLATARAVAGLNVLLELAAPFLRVGGHFIAYKGPSVDGEAGEAMRAASLLGMELKGIFNAKIPDRDWDHRLAVYKKLRSTPSMYPRKPGEPERRPL